MSKLNRLLNIIVNSVIIVLVLVAVIMMCFSESDVLSGSKAEALKFFTVQSNLFVGVSSIISLIYIIFLKDKYPLWLVIVKLASVTSVAITFMTVMVYLGPFFGYPLVLSDANLFMHLIVPLLAIAQLVLVEPKVKMKFIHNLYSIIPVTLYGIVYLINVTVHDDFGNVKGFDWYGFGYYGAGIGVLCLLAIILMGFGLSVGIYFLYQKTKINKLFE